MFNLTGKLVFQPQRPNDFRKQNKLETLVLELRGCNDISKYYIKLIEQELGPWTNLASPMFGMHVTIVRGNSDRFDPKQLAKVSGQEMTVTVDPLTLERTPWSKNNPAFWTMEVKSPKIHQLRVSLGVKPIYDFLPHLTVARENGLFFMHAKLPSDPLKAAKRALELVPGHNSDGNQQLRADLKAFIGSYCVDVSADANRLVSIIHKHVNFPSKDWERAVLNLFKRKTVT